MNAKRILGLHRTDTYDLYDHFTKELGKGLEKCGVKFDIIDDPGAEKGPELIASHLSSISYDAVIVFNALGQQDYELNGRNIWKAHSIPFINYILDHPAEHQKELRSASCDMHVICIDSEHADLVRTWFPHIRSAHYLPVGGSGHAFPSDPESRTGRAKDITYIGVHEDLNGMIRILSDYPPHTGRLIANLIDLMLDHRELSYHQALHKILNDCGLSGLSSEEELGYAVICRIACRYIRAYAREEIIRYLLSEKQEWTLHIYGSGWDAVNSESAAKAMLHPPVPYKDTPEIYADSKIVLNVMSHFKNALLDRIPSAMLSGALVFSDRTSFLENLLPAGSVSYYDADKPGNAGASVSLLLSDPSEAFRIADNGHNYALTHLTWENTARKLLTMLPV